MRGKKRGRWEWQRRIAAGFTKLARQPSDLSRARQNNEEKEKKTKTKNSRESIGLMIRETSEKENQNVYERKEENRTSDAAAGCVSSVLAHFPDWKLAFLPHPFCSSTVLRVSVTLSASCVCKAPFFYLHPKETSSNFEFNVSMGNCFLASLVVGLFRPESPSVSTRIV